MCPFNPKYDAYRTRDFLYQQYFIENKSSTDIAKDIGCAPITVRQWMRENRLKRRNNSEAITLWHSGHEHPKGMLGKKRSEESNEKIRAWYRKNKHPMLGKNHPQAVREKMSRIAIKRFKTEKPWNWQGRGPENHNIRTSTAFMNWRQKILTYNNYTCQCCLEKSDNMHIHHIIPFAIAPEERFEISNGAALCKMCHRQVHGEEY